MISRNFIKRFNTSIFLFFLIYLIYKIDMAFVYTLLVLGVLSIIEFFSITKKFIKKKINYLLLNTFFLIYLSFFCLIILFFYNSFETKIIIFSLILCCVASDIGGFIFGKLFKGPKLTKISPKKTISGSIGSVVLACVFLVFLFNFLFNYLSLTVFLISIITSISCQVGDLFFSYLKRRANIKDTGNIFPGHGGVLDRLDGILLVVPIGFLGFIFFL